MGGGEPGRVSRLHLRSTLTNLPRVLLLMPFRDTFYRPSVPSGLRGLAPNAPAHGALGRNDESTQRPNDRAHNVDSFDSKNFTFWNILVYLSVNESRFFVTRFGFLVGDRTKHEKIK